MSFEGEGDKGEIIESNKETLSISVSLKFLRTRRFQLEERKKSETEPYFSEREGENMRERRAQRLRRGPRIHPKSNVGAIS